MHVVLIVEPVHFKGRSRYIGRLKSRAITFSSVEHKSCRSSCHSQATSASMNEADNTCRNHFQTATLILQFEEIFGLLDGKVVTFRTFRKSSTERYPPQYHRPPNSVADLAITAMHLLDLPSEILAEIPHHLSTLWDHYSLLRTCRLFHQISQTNAGDPSLPLSSSSTEIDASPQSVPKLSPYPHHLLAGMARHIADWGVESCSNRKKLRRLIGGGRIRLLQFGCGAIRLRLSSLHALQAQKAELLDPLSSLLENTCGISGKAESLGVSVEACFVCDSQEGAIHRSEICSFPSRALLNYWIYIELFHHDLERALAGRERAKTMPSLGLQVRQFFWICCLPNRDDWDRRGAEWVKRYEPVPMWDQRLMWEGAVFKRRRRALERFWETGEMVVVVDEEAEEEGRKRFERRREAFVIAAVNEGLVSLRMLLPGGMEEVKGRLEEIRQRVRGMDERDLWVKEENAEDEEEAKEEGGYWGGMYRDLVLLGRG